MRRGERLAHGARPARVRLWSLTRITATLVRSGQTGARAPAGDCHQKRNQKDMTFGSTTLLGPVGWTGAYGWRSDRKRPKQPRMAFAPTPQVMVSPRLIPHAYSLYGRRPHQWEAASYSKHEWAKKQKRVQPYAFIRLISRSPGSRRGIADPGLLKPRMAVREGTRMLQTIMERVDEINRASWTRSRDARLPASDCGIKPASRDKTAGDGWRASVSRRSRRDGRTLQLAGDRT